MWAHKSTALSAAHFMLAAGGGIRHVSNGRNGQFKGESSARLPRKAEVCMVVSAGKRTAKGVYGERFRFEKTPYKVIK